MLMPCALLTYNVPLPFRGVAQVGALPAGWMGAGAGAGAAFYHVSAAALTLTRSSSPPGARPSAGSEAGPDGDGDGHVRNEPAHVNHSGKCHDFSSA